MCAQKIHFINRLDYVNTGDMSCSPLNYYYDFFKDYNIIRHDISGIYWREISPNDIVILGGGGLLSYSNFWQNSINKILEMCPNTIVWGMGHNNNPNLPLNVQLNYDKFKMFSIRDYNYPCFGKYEYLPCPSCKHPYLSEVKKEIKRQIGVAQHKFIPIAKKFSYESLDNSENFEIVIDFIASSEIIVSNSYHMLYWSMLMGKKAICTNPFSERFKYYKYKPALYSGNLENDIREAVVYPGILDENRALNDAFFERVKRFTETTIKEKSSSYQRIFEMTRYVVDDQNLKKHKLDKHKKYSERLIKLLSNFIPNKKMRRNFREKFQKES